MRIGDGAGRRDGAEQMVSGSQGFRIAVIAAGIVAFGAAGCSSARLSGGGRPDYAPPAPVGASAGSGPTVIYNDAPDAPAPGPYGGYGAPSSGPITAEPLPPPGGAVAPGPVATPGTVMDPNIPGGGGAVVAARPPEEPRAVTPPPAGRLGAVGTWRARDAAGGSCRLNLSSAQVLELNRASASSCANRDLARITAWENRDGEIYLYQPGGNVVARLRPGGEGYEGVLTKSGASISMAR